MVPKSKKIKKKFHNSPEKPTNPIPENIPEKNISENISDTNPRENSEKNIQVISHTKKLKKKFHNSDSQSQESKKPENNIFDLEKPDQIYEKDDNYTIDGFFAHEYSIEKNKWYAIQIKTKNDHMGLLKIFDNNKKQIFPVIKLPHNFFIYDVKNSTELIFKLYFKSLDTNIINIYIVGTTIDRVEIKPVIIREIQNFYEKINNFKNIHDELINYYNNNL